MFMLGFQAAVALNNNAGVDKIGVRKTKNRTNVFCSHPSPIKSFRQNFLCGKFINLMFPFKTVGVPYMSYNSYIIRTLAKFSTTGLIFKNTSDISKKYIYIEQLSMRTKSCDLCSEII